ncbi:unnamed protein product [Adineta steineri]|uniref:Neurotransmitter-gated ion-channel ligand-binding domain-containing protein n=1 Tax=Adineta steineri TaxID=433720 RepID=A0A818L7G5_9BILA|nr:unnamed protein product [Adineta steineri]CAF3567430.1 unnamed protein product [Adineta steineri]
MRCYKNKALYLYFKGCTGIKYLDMIKSLTFVILLSYLFDFGDCGTLPDSQLAEQTLITSLLSGYNKNIRPNDTVSVDITAQLQQIVAIDEKQQIMTTSSFISQTWFDDRLSWTPNNSNNNIQVVLLPVTSLWIPDTMILNSADANGYLTVSTYSMASVSNTGQVYMILPALTVKTRCNFYVRYFPFDKQVCSISLTSWSQGSNRIIYTEDSNTVIDISDYTEHPLWKLNGTDMVVIRAEDRTPFEDTYNDVITIQLYLQRKPLFFILNGIFACWVLNSVTLVSHALPFAAQIGLCMTCFMTYSVYSLNFSNLFPQQSQYLMMITFYFLLSICWTLISMIWFVLCNHFITKGEMPKLLYSFSEWLQKRIFLFCFPLPKQDKPNPSCFRQNIKVENIDMDQHFPIENATSIGKNNIDDTRIETNNKAKSECNFCNRCETCQADFNKDKVKGNNKKDIEAKCSALNCFVFFCLLLVMTISELSIWITMSE